MNSIDLFGFLACVCTVSAFVPQVWVIWKTKSTKDISLLMYGIFTLGLISWLIYGWKLQALPILVTNSLTLCLVVVIIYFKLKYK